MTENNVCQKNGAEQPVTVNLGKLVEGVGTVFAGVMKMLEAFEVHTDEGINVSGLAGVIASAEKGGKDADYVKENADSVHNAVERSEDAEETEASLESDTSAGNNDAGNSPADEGVKKEADVSDSGSAVSGLTKDDLTKVIVQKIKQNRSNNAKIGSILKTYGVAKVSELPAEKYEAFLTDLSQI